VSPSVYYRVYSLTSGVEVKNPEFPKDPYLGCALAIRIPPPHLAASLKRNICGREDITDYEHTSLFTDISCLTPLDDSEVVHILDHAGIGSMPGDPVAVVSLTLGASERNHVPDSVVGYRYTLKANVNRKVNSCTSGQVSDGFCSGNTTTSGWLAIKKHDILHTDGVPIKGEASCFNSKVHEAVSHSTTFQTHITIPMMVFTLQTMLQKLVVVRTNLLIGHNLKIYCLVVRLSKCCH